AVRIRSRPHLAVSSSRATKSRGEGRRDGRLHSWTKTARNSTSTFDAAQCDLTPFEAAVAGYGIDTNWVASRRPLPSGVGSENRYGARNRVPAMGASHTSMSRNPTRYLITGRSGIWPATGVK